MNLLRVGADGESKLPRLFFRESDCGICGRWKPGGKEGLEEVAVEVMLPSVKEAAELAGAESKPRYGLESEMSSSRGSSSLRLAFGIVTI